MLNQMRVSEGPVRQFESGATRNTDHDKLDFDGFISPIVLEAYARYMHKHRLQSDGKLRDSDNWQKLFGEKHKEVCMKSGWRHFFSWWKAHRGYKTEESIEDSLMALMFNINAYMHKVELDKYSDSIPYLSVDN